MTCDLCGSPDLVTTTSDVVCIRCGCCVSPVFSFDQYLWQQDRLVTLQPLHPRGTLQGRQPQPAHGWLAYNLENNRRIRLSAYIHRILHQLAFEGDTYQALYRAAWQFAIHQRSLVKSGRGRKSPSLADLAAASVLIVARRQGTPLGVREVLRNAPRVKGRARRRPLLRLLAALPYRRLDAHAYLAPAISVVITHLRQRRGNGWDEDALAAQIRQAAEHLLRVTPANSSVNPRATAAASVYAACKQLRLRGVGQALWQAARFACGYTVRDRWMLVFRPMMEGSR